MYHKAISDDHATPSTVTGPLTTSEPPKADGALVIFPSEKLVVDEARKKRAALWRAWALGREKLGEELHVVELALDGMREHDLRARHERGRDGVVRMDGGCRERVSEHFGEGRLLYADYDMCGLESWM